MHHGEHCIAGQTAQHHGLIHGGDRRIGSLYEQHTGLGPTVEFAVQGKSDIVHVHRDARLTLDALGPQGVVVERSAARGGADDPTAPAPEVAGHQPQPQGTHAASAAVAPPIRRE